MIEHLVQPIEPVPMARPLNPWTVVAHDERLATCAPAACNASPRSPAPEIPAMLNATSLAPAALNPACFAPTAFGPATTQLAAPRLLPPREACCVASAVCGLTALVPVASQLAGLALGLIGLARIRAARRRGEDMRGAGWAVAGLCSSGLMLLVWLGTFAALASAGSALHKAAAKLPLSTQAE
ncbi:MAG: hypothetical protein IT449_00955 [Phycisphaerales bacterium]|nr:hypothetical protein [Phycisphaerales bacterium]